MTDQEKEYTKASFFAMIRNATTPADADATREVFGDWCEEHGEAELAAMLRGGSRQWLDEFCHEWHCGDEEDYYLYTVEELVQAAVEGDFFTAGGVGLHSASELGEGVEAEFWRHIQVMTGIDFDEEHRDNFAWSCSC